jgi:hypothetical protein
MQAWVKTPMPVRDPYQLSNNVFPGLSHKGKQSDVAGAFDSASDRALVAGAGACLPTGANFACVGDKAGQQVHVFVINFDVFISAELANFGAGDITSPTLRCAVEFLIFHFIYSKTQYGKP